MAIRPSQEEQWSSSPSSENGVLDSLRDFLYASSLPGPYFAPKAALASETASSRASRGRRRGRGAQEEPNPSGRDNSGTSSSAVRLALANPSLHEQRSDAATALLVLAAARGTAADLLIAVKVLLGVGLPCHTDEDAVAFQRAAAAEAQAALQHSTTNSNHGNRRRGGNVSGLASEQRDANLAAAGEPTNASLKPPLLEVPNNSSSSSSSHVLSRRRLPLTKGRLPSRKHAVSAAEAALDAALEAADESNDYSKLHKEKGGDWGHLEKDWSKAPPTARGDVSRLDPLGVSPASSRQRAGFEKAPLPLPAKDFEALDPAATDDGGCATWESDYEVIGFGAVNAKAKVGLLQQQQQQPNPDDDEDGEAAATVGLAHPPLEYQWGSVDKKQARMLLKPDLLKKSPPAPVTSSAAMPTMMVGSHDASNSSGSGREARDFLPLLMQKEPLSAKSLLRAKQQQQAATQAVGDLHEPQGLGEEPAESVPAAEVQNAKTVESKSVLSTFARPTVAPLRGAAVLQALRHLAAAPVPRAITHHGHGHNEDADGATSSAAAAEVWTCGQNAYGELGHSELGPLGPRPTLSRVEALVGKRVRGVAAGNEHTVVVTKDGQVMSVGYNDNGQCGTGSLGRCDSFAAVAMNVTAAAVNAIDGKPTEEQTSEGSSSEESSAGNSTKAVASSVHAYNGCEHTVVVLKDGRAVSFGYNYRGQLGHSAAQSEPIPKLVRGLEGHRVSHVSCSYYHTLLACSDGTVFSFGRGDHGQLGHGDAVDRKHPTRVDSLSRAATTVTAAAGVVSLGCGQYHSCVVLSDGRVLGCGKNDYGQVGVESPESQRQFVTVKLPAAASAVQSVACGYYHSVVLCVSGSVYGWGRCDYGQLGLGYASARAFGPHCIEKLENCGACVVACGCYHTVVASSDGTLHVMGRNNHGQLGTGNTVEAHAPVVLPQFKGRKVRGVACGFYHTVVLTGGGHNDSSDSDESNGSECEDNSENGSAGVTSSLPKGSSARKRSRRRKANALATAPQPFSPEFLLNLPQFSLDRSNIVGTEPEDPTTAGSTAEEQASSMNSSSLPANESAAAPQGDDDEENESLVPRALCFKLPEDEATGLEDHGLHSFAASLPSGALPASGIPSTASSTAGTTSSGHGGRDSQGATTTSENNSTVSTRLQRIAQQDATSSSGSSLVDHKGSIVPERAAMFMLAHLARLSTTGAPVKGSSGESNAIPPVVGFDSMRNGDGNGSVNTLRQLQQQPYSVDAKPATLEALLSLLASLHRTIMPLSTSSSSKATAAPVREHDSTLTVEGSAASSGDGASYESNATTMNKDNSAPPSLPGFDGGGSLAAQAAYTHVYHPTMVLSCLQILTANFHAFLASPIAAAVVDTLRAKSGKHARRKAPGYTPSTIRHHDDSDGQVEPDDPSAQLNSSKGATKGALSRAAAAASTALSDRDDVTTAKGKRRGRQGTGSGPSWVPDSSWTSGDFEEQRRALLFALPPLTRGTLPRGNRSGSSGEASSDKNASGQAAAECWRYCAVLPLLQQQLMALVMGAAAATEAEKSSPRSSSFIDVDNADNHELSNVDGTSSVMVQVAAADLLVLGLEMFYPSAHAQVSLLQDLLNTPPSISKDNNDVKGTLPLFGAAAARHFLLQPLLKKLSTDAFASKLLPSTLGSSSSTKPCSNTRGASTDACAALDSLLQVLVVHCSSDGINDEGIAMKGMHGEETRRLMTALLLALQTHLASWSASGGAPTKIEAEAVAFDEPTSTALVPKQNSAVAQAAAALDRDAVLTPGWACLLGYIFRNGSDKRPLVYLIIRYYICQVLL